MSLLSTDDIERRCKDLVIQVAYAFYDSPYIIILYQLMHQPVWQETKLAERLGINSNELRRYFGKLQTHRLVKRYTNKEKIAGEDKFQPRPQSSNRIPGANPDGTRMRDVFYWYIDYREFAQVTKYRLAMVRKGIEEATKQMGFACPQCGKTFEVLQVRDLMDPSTGLLYCDQCSSEVTSYDPNMDPSKSSNAAANADKMQHFNTSMRGIRDALKAIEEVTVPSLNIVAWIAQNVVVAPVPGEEVGVDEKAKYKIVIGEGGDEKERAERARLAESQRTQNALPVWYTHSTVTGSATALGIKSDGSDQAGPSSRKFSTDGGEPKRDLADYYANLEEEDEEEEEELGTPVNVGGTPVPISERVKVEPGFENEQDEEQEDVGDSLDATPVPGANGAEGEAMVMVAGVAKPFSSITDEDEAYMTAEEREAYEALVMEM